LIDFSANPGESGGVTQRSGLAESSLIPEGTLAGGAETGPPMDWRKPADPERPPVVR
jgi:hypothetical protein